MKFSEYITEAIKKNLTGQNVVASNSRRYIDTPYIMKPEDKGSIWDGYIDCRMTGIMSLDGAPQRVKGNFYCNGNKLTTLKGAPESVEGVFDCSENKLLRTLKGCPSEIDGPLICTDCGLTSLKGAPKKVGSGFNCAFNDLTSLEGAPSIVGGRVLCCNNELRSLKDIHKVFTSINGYFDCRDNPIISHVLGVLLIDKMREFHIDNQNVTDIVNHYIGKGRKGMIDAQNDLIEAGYEEYAQL